MSNIVYTLKQNPITSEYHLFEATPTIDRKCTPQPKSMCGIMKNIANYKFACKSEKDTFIECAKLGRLVCGNCMKELYGTNN